MSKLIPHEINKMQNFISGWYLESDLMDRMIKAFEDNPDLQTEGGFGDNQNRMINKSWKSCTEMGLISFPKLFEEYYWYLQKSLELYTKQYIMVSEFSKFNVEEGINLQKYNAGDGYFGWHFERSHPSTKSRVLVFMTYLNDLEENQGGKTEFFYQGVKITPKKGLTLLWPTDWTHTHRGNKVLSGKKYIATGWYNFVENNKGE